MKFVTPYKQDHKVPFATRNDEPSLTQQSDMKETDINVILKKYGVSQFPQITSMQPLYGDFSEIRSYRDALDRVRAADEAFLEVPAHIRADFNNDPEKFMEFVHDPENKDKMREYGLLAPEPDVSTVDALRREINDDPPDIRDQGSQNGGVQPSVSPTDTRPRNQDVPPNRPPQGRK